MESLQKRIANVLVSNAKTKKRKAQMDMEKQVPKVDPKVKILDKCYEALSDEDCASALDCLYKLTTNLHLADDVSFDIPEDHDEEGDDDKHGFSEEGDHEFRSHRDKDEEDTEPESHIRDLSTED